MNMQMRNKNGLGDEMSGMNVSLISPLLNICVLAIDQ